MNVGGRIGTTEMEVDDKRWGGMKIDWEWRGGTERDADGHRATSSEGSDVRPIRPDQEYKTK